MNRFALMPFDALIREAEELEQQLAEANKLLEAERVISHKWYNNATTWSREKAESNKKLAEQQAITRAVRDLAIWMTGCGFDFAGLTYFTASRYLLTSEVGGGKELATLLAKAKEEGRAEAQARIKVLEELATSLLKHAGTKIHACNLQYEEVMLNTSPTEALDKVVREAKEDMRERCAYEVETMSQDCTRYEYAEAIRRIEP